MSVIQNGGIIATDSPSELKHRVGGHVLEIELDGGEENKEKAADIVREAGIFEEKSRC